MIILKLRVQPLTMGDLCEIVGTDRKVADFVKQMPVTGLQTQETGRVLSVLMLVEAITVQVQKQFAGIQCQCVLLGAEQLIVEWGRQKDGTVVGDDFEDGMRQSDHSGGFGFLPS